MFFFSLKFSFVLLNVFHEKEKNIYKIVSLQANTKNNYGERQHWITSAELFVHNDSQNYIGTGIILVPPSSNFEGPNSKSFWLMVLKIYVF